MGGRHFQLSIRNFARKEEKSRLSAEYEVWRKCTSSYPCTSYVWSDRGTWLIDRASYVGNYQWVGY